MKIKIGVCAGNIESLRGLEEKIRCYTSGMEPEMVMKTWCYGELVIKDLENRRFCPDILFLDIDIPRIAGLDIAAKLRALGYTGKIIFMASSEAYYLEAFDVHAYHYLPQQRVTEERFEQVLDRCIRDIMEDEMEYIILNRAGETLKIALDKILYFESFGRALALHYLKHGKETEFEFYSTMGRMENLLLGHGFIRCHRGFLVSFRYITSVSRQEIELTNGKKVLIGRSYYRQVKEEIQLLQNPMKFRPKMPQV